MPRSPKAFLLFVSELPLRLSACELLSIFASYRSITVLRLSESLRCKEALLTFYDYSERQKAKAEMSETVIDSRGIFLAELRAAKKIDLAARIAIGNLPECVRVADLERCFRQYGEVLGAYVERDSRGTSLRRGFVQFALKESADLAISKRNHTEWHSKEGELVEVAQWRDDITQTDAAHLRVTGFALTTPEAEIRSLFAQFGEIRSLIVSMQVSGKTTKAIAYVDYENVDNAVPAYEALRQKEALGGLLAISLPGKFEEKLKFRIERAVKVTCERSQLTTLKCKEAFERFGVVQGICLNHLRRRTNCIVMFEEKEAAVRALAESSMIVDGNTLTVKVCSSRKDKGVLVAMEISEKGSSDASNPELHLPPTVAAGLPKSGAVPTPSPTQTSEETKAAVSSFPKKNITRKLARPIVLQKVKETVSGMLAENVIAWIVRLKKPELAKCCEDPDELSKAIAAALRFFEERKIKRAAKREQKVAKKAVVTRAPEMPRGSSKRQFAVLRDCKAKALRRLSALLSWESSIRHATPYPLVQRTRIGNFLYVSVRSLTNAAIAEKLTGMILKLDLELLFRMVRDRRLLRTTVETAMEVLAEAWEGDEEKLATLTIRPSRLRPISS